MSVVQPEASHRRQITQNAATCGWPPASLDAPICALSGFSGRCAVSLPIQTAMVALCLPGCAYLAKQKSVRFHSRCGAGPFP